MKRTRSTDFRTGMTRVMISTVLLVAFAPRGFGQVPVVHVDFSKSDSEIPITRWQLLGPFRFDAKDLGTPGVERLPLGLNHDYLNDFAQDEASVDAQSFPLIKTPKAEIVLDQQFGNGPISTTAKTNILELATIERPLDFAVAYVAATLDSPNDEDIVIAVGVDDNMQLRLNHELLVSDPNTIGHSLTKYQRLIGGRLKKGTNFLLIKIGNLTGDWRLIVNLYPHNKGLTLAGENAVNPIVTNSVVSGGEPIELRGDLLARTSSVQLTITDSRHQIVDTASLALERVMRKELGKLSPNGLYTCHVSAGSETIDKPFYYGNLGEGYEQLSREVGKAEKSDESVAIDLRAQLARLKHLLEPESRKSEFWDQKVAWSFAELETNLADASKGAAAFRHAPGTHLRGYRSSVDGQVQNYWIHVPESAVKSGKPIPMVIALPYTTGQNLPFLESYFLAAFDETERYRMLGDKFGFAVLQVWGRGNHLGGTAIGAADVFEALEAVRREYVIDQDRIYLLGYCEAGRLALLLGERYPERFAAVATVAPITIVHNRNPEIAKWIEYASPITGVQKLVNIPVLIRHDEADMPPPIQESAFFTQRSREAGADVVLTRVQGGIHGFYQDPMAEKRALFEFFNGKQRKATPPGGSVVPLSIGIGTGTGPIEDAFGGPVLIVEGTLGDLSEREAIESVVQGLQEEWRETYFVESRVKRDNELKAADLEKYNLIVVGDKQTNALIGRISELLPLRVVADRVSLGGRAFQGEHLGYEFISPNPLNPKRYVVVVGMNKWARVKDWRLNPSRDGISDFVVYDLRGPAPRKLGVGYFEDAFWQRPASIVAGESKASKR